MADDAPHRCPFFDDRERYNAELNGGKGFTLKEILVDLHKEFHGYRDSNDKRVGKLENWKSGIVAIGGVLVFVIPVLIRIIYG